MSILRLARLALAAPLLALGGLSATATAQSYPPVVVDCSFATNMCSAGVESPSSPGPLRYLWTFESSSTDAIFPEDCTFQDTCSFWCPRYPGTFPVTLEVYEANWQLIGSDSTWAVCTQQDMVLPH